MTKPWKHGEDQVWGDRSSLKENPLETKKNPIAKEIEHCFPIVAATATPLSVNVFATTFAFSYLWPDAAISLTGITVTPPGDWVSAVTALETSSGRQRWRGGRGNLTATTSSLPRKPADTRMNDWDQISNSGRCHVRPRASQLGLPRGSVALGHL